MTAPMPKSGQILHLPAWKDIRAFVARRADYRCQHCGVFLGMRGQADHIISRRVLAETGGDPLDPSNVQYLCPSCHSKKTAQEKMAGREPRERRRPRTKIPGRKSFLLAAGLKPKDIV